MTLRRKIFCCKAEKKIYNNLLFYFSQTKTKLPLNEDKKTDIRVTEPSLYKEILIMLVLSKILTK